jgi:hypothetical protein
MASNQGNYDAASNTPLWAAATVNLAPTVSNVTNLYGNTTSNAFFTGETVGVFAVDDNEVQVAGSKGAHAGWILRTTGSGGRAGRVTEETLSVVAKFITDNNADDAVYPDASITFGSQPASRQLYSNTANANSTTFSVSVASVQPTGAAVSYVWQYNTTNGALGWTTVNNGSAQIANTLFSGNTTSTLTTVPSYNDANTYVFRAIATATPPAGVTNATAVSVTSANASIVVLLP